MKMTNRKYSSRPSDKQRKYEEFLSQQNYKERLNWFRCLPVMLTAMVEFINESKQKLTNNQDLYKKFTSITLPELRKEYKIINDILKQDGKPTEKDELTSISALSAMIFKINGWQRDTHFGLGIKKTVDHTYYGKAQIIKEFEIIKTEVSYGR